MQPYAPPAPVAELRDQFFAMPEDVAAGMTVDGSESTMGMLEETKEGKQTGELSLFSVRAMSENMPPAATTKPKLDWRRVASQASEKQAQDPAAAADVLRSVLQMQADAPEVRRELGKLRCALGFALGAAGEVSPAAAEFSAVLRLAEQGRQPGSVQPETLLSRLDRFGLGKKRSLEAFLDVVGLDLEHRSIDTGEARRLIAGIGVG